MQSNTRPFKNYHEATKQFVAMLVEQGFIVMLLNKWISRLDKVFAEIMKVTELNYDIIQTAYLTQIAGDRFPSKYNDLKKIPAFKQFIRYINKIDVQNAFRMLDNMQNLY